MYTDRHTHVVLQIEQGLRPAHLLTQRRPQRRPKTPPQTLLNPLYLLCHPRPRPRRHLLRRSNQDRAFRRVLGRKYECGRVEVAECSCGAVVELLVVPRLSRWWYLLLGCVVTTTTCCVFAVFRARLTHGASLQVMMYVNSVSVRRRRQSTV